MVLDALRRMAGGSTGRKTATAGLLRRVRGRGRQVMGASLSLVTTAGMFLVPAAVTAGVAASAVAVAPPAKAASGLPVLVVLVNGEATAPETTLLTSAGYTVTQVAPATLASMSKSTFQGYAAVVIGDSSTSTSCSTMAPSTSSLGSQWEPWVNGNVAVLGTAPVMPGTTGANALIADAVKYAAAQPASSSVTGLYVSLNCGYSTAAAGTAVSLLSGVDSIGTAGGVTVNGSLACSDPGTVNKWEGAAAGTFGGFTSDSLGTGAWPSPACPVREAFDSWPAMFTPVAYDAGSDATANFTASDGVTGQPYILLGAPLPSGTAALAPGTGGEVPQGTTAGGTNRAAPGVVHAMAADPVDTESGDFTQSATDFSIPTFGPSLSFTRTYDAHQAQQETVAGTPGPMGYGWTDSWASSLSTGRPVPGDIYAVDGEDTWDGNGFVPTSQTLWSPGAVAQYGGDTYIADTAENRIEEIAGSTKTQWGISMTAGHMYTVAGNQYGASGQSGNGTAAASTFLNQPQGVAVNASGLYIADAGNCRVVEIAASTGTQWGISMTAADMYGIAGRGTNNCGAGGDNTAATASNLNFPSGLALGVGSHAGDLYIADTGNNRVQEIPIASGTEWGQSMTANDVYTVAGSPAGTDGTSASGGSQGSSLLEGPVGVMIGGGDNLYVADTGNCRVMEAPWGSGAQWGISMTAGDLYTIAGRNGPSNCAIGDDAKSSTQSDLDTPSAVWAGNGNLYIADTGNNRVQEVAGSAHTEFGQSMTADFVYTVAGNWNATAGFSGDGGVGSSALLDYPDGVWVDGSGDLWVSDTYNNRLREVSGSTNDISTVAGNGGTRQTWGNGGPGVWAGLLDASDVAADSQGDLFIADSDNNRVQEIAASTHTQFGISMTAGDVYTVAGSSIGNSGTSGDGGIATSALLLEPEGVAADAAGNLYIADTDNNRVQEVSASTGDIATVAGSASGTAGTSGDGGKATSALLGAPISVAVDSNGNVYIADDDNSRVQEIAGATGTQRGVSMTAADIYTVAGSSSGNAGYSGDGGTATSALLSNPAGVAVDAAGNLYIADQGNDVVREVAYAAHTQWARAMAAGDIYTVAGNASIGGAATGDGGPATSAALNQPDSVAVDPAGDLFIADTQNGRIQEVPGSNGTQWSQSMTAAHIYTVAGSAAGTQGESGDGGPATSAQMDQPAGMAIDPWGNLFTADDSYVREMVSSAAAPFKVFPSASSGLGITINQADGSQVTFYPKTSGGACTAPYVAASGTGYCTLPQDTGAGLTYNSSAGTYTYTPAPGSAHTYSGSTGALLSEADAAGYTLTVTASSPAPGSGNCPSSASSCTTITAANGRAIVVGLNPAGLVTSVTDPLARRWTYAYNSASRLTSATDPTGNVTSYSYGVGSTGNAQLASDLLTVTAPNAQPGGPDAGDATVNVYDSEGRVTSQTDPMGKTTTFSYCVSAAAGDCMNAATGTGFVTVTDPDASTSVYEYDQGTLAAQSDWTKTASSLTLTSENDSVPDTTAPSSSNPSGGTLLATSSTNGDGDTTTTSYDNGGDPTSVTSPGANGAPATMTTAYTASLQQSDCTGTAEAAPAAACSQDSPPTPVAPGGVITPPSSAPPEGVAYTLYDTDGNELYTTTGVYEPGATTAAYSQTSYQLFKGNSVTLNGTRITCAATPPSVSLPCATINADGVVTQLAYDSAGDLISSSAPDGNGSEIATTDYAYDASGERTSTISPDGNLTGANRGNYTTTAAYNGDGQRTSVTVGGGSGATVTPRTTTYGYDANGDQVTVQDARGYATTTTYNADNQAVLVKNPAGNATLSCYNSAGEVAETVPAAGVAAGGLSAASCPSFGAVYSPLTNPLLAPDATMYTYDASGQKTAVYSPAPAGQSGYETTTYTYDDGGNLIETVAPPASNAGGAPDDVTYDAYDAAGQLVSETAGYGTSAASTVSYCYDPDGGETSVVYADGTASGTAPCQTAYPWTVSSSAYPVQAAYQTTYSHDSFGDLASTTAPATAAAPSGATTTATYDPVGNKLTSTDPDGVTTTYTYKPGNLVASVSYSGSAAHSVTYTYDADGSKTAMTDAAGTSSYSYNPFGELTSATNGAGQAVTYSYDADGDNAGISYPLPSSATWATSDSVSYGYDNADRLTSVTDFTGHAITITDNADGLLSSEAVGSTGDTITASYDSADGPSAISLANSSSTLQSFSYADAPAGNVLTETDTPASATTPAGYGYDAQERVTSDTPGSGTAQDYAYDASGNLTTLPNGAAGGYNDAGELTTATLAGTATSYAYSADGERQSATQGSTTTASGTWNGAQQLGGYDDSAAQMTGTTYDGNGLRVAATFTPAGGSAVTEDYVWDGDSLLMDSGNAYIYSSNEDTPAEQVNLATGAITYLVTDSLGSVRGTVNSTGALTGTTSYDAWGNPQAAGGLTASTPFGYAGGYTDPDGLIYLINRYYDPATGQFISVDPDVTDTNQPYSYASGNPVDNADPLGLYTLGVCLGIGGAFGPISGAAGDCLNRTQRTNSDDIGWTYTVAGGLGFGAGYGVSIYYEVSTCRTLACLSGWFHYFGWGFSYFVGMTATVFWGNWDDDGNPTTFGADFGISAGEGGEVAEGYSYTWVNKYTCGSNWVCKGHANAARAAWWTLTRPVSWLVNDIALVTGWATTTARWLIKHGR
jgi:trimeric autotransporter adhesin